jgi:hypothetical protein
LPKPPPRPPAPSPPAEAKDEAGAPPFLPKGVTLEAFRLMSPAQQAAVWQKYRDQVAAAGAAGAAAGGWALGVGLAGVGFLGGAASHRAGVRGGCADPGRSPDHTPYCAGFALRSGVTYFTAVVDSTNEKVRVTPYMKRKVFRFYRGFRTGGVFKSVWYAPSAFRTGSLELVQWGTNPLSEPIRDALSSIDPQFTPPGKKRARAQGGDGSAAAPAKKQRRQRGPPVS